ncbi:hypothetical protein ACEN33_03280 [Ruoffia sp. FAM 24228]|uniref:hypothetical protein n=1 Tax=Ruoffia sp. FAM 24228 TaxID=3259517 RepID=UPI0038874AB1
MTETYGYDKTPTPPRDYDVSKVPPEIKKRTEWVKSKFTGEDVAEAYRQAGDIAGIYAGEAKKIAENTNKRQDVVEDQFDAVQRAATETADWGGEIVVASDGEPTLGHRISRDVSDLTSLSGANPLKYGAHGNAVDGDADGIIAALAENNYVKLPFGKRYVIDKEIVIEKGKELDLNGNRIVFSHDSSTFNISPGGTLRKGRVFIAEHVIMEKSVLYFDGNKQFVIGDETEAVVEDVYAERTGSNAYQGTFLWMDARQKDINRGAIISGLKLKNLTSKRFEYSHRNTVEGIPSAATNSYITSNTITNLTAFNPRNFIWEDDIVGVRSSTGGNNWFSPGCQPGEEQEKVFLKLEGDKNSILDANFWDNTRPSNIDNQVIINGNYNKITGVGIPSFNTSYVANNGRYNTINGRAYGFPADYVPMVIAERSLGIMHKGTARTLDFVANQSIAQKVASTTSATLWEETLSQSNLPEGYCTYKIKGFGTAVAPHKKTMMILINDDYIDGVTTSDSHATKWDFECVFVVRKYATSIVVKTYLTSSEGSLKLIGNRTINNVTNDLKLEIRFSSNQANGFTCEYLETYINRTL